MTIPKADKRRQTRHIEDSKRHNEVDITNFINQELYKTAFQVQYPKEYKQYRQLIKHVERELTPFKLEFVYGQTDRFDQFIEEMFDALVHNYDLIDVARSYERIDDNELSAQLLGILTQLNRAIDIPTEINHQYPPSVLGHDFNYLHALIYQQKKDFEPSFINEGGDYRSCSVIQRPFWYVLPYRHIPVAFFETCRDVNIPEQAMSRRLFNKEPDFKVLLQDTDNLDAGGRIITQLDAYGGETSFEKIDTLHIDIDLTRPMTQADYILVLRKIEAQIASAQRQNNGIDILLAENSEEMWKIACVPDLKDTTSMLEFRKSQAPELPDQTSPKQLLIGLIAYHAFVIGNMPTEVDAIIRSERTPICKEKSYTQEEIFKAMEKYLTKNGISGSGLESISRNYKQTKVLIDRLVAMWHT